VRSLAILLAALWAGAAAATAQEVGPEHGALVIVGGGLRDQAIVERFIALAGGPDAPIVVIPTAGEDDRYDQYWSGLGQLRTAGARQLTVLHTRDRTVANTVAFVAPLTTARGVWFPGGRHWRLADAYLDTRTQVEIAGVLARGGVVGGTSAGATILGSYLVRGDTRGNTIMMGDHEVGFGFLRNTAIDQHLLRRNRQFDMIGVIEKRPDLLGIGIDENTAIVVRGDTFDVIGQSYVAIYDNHRMLGTDGRFYLLQPGDRFDLRTREATRPATTGPPVQGLRRREWPGRERR
jgi:cyanophycinase